MTGSMRQIVGREHEIDVLFAAIDAAMSAGCAIAICGEPGIGKSVLIDAAARYGRDRGHLVLQTTGVEAEYQLPFAGLHELIRPVLGTADTLAPAQRRALMSAFGIEEAGSPEHFLICLAALNVLSHVPASTQWRFWREESAMTQSSSWAECAPATPLPFCPRVTGC
jgi:hypothetical protein